MTYIDIVIILFALLGFTIGWNLRGIYIITIPIAFFSGILFANLLYPFLSDFLIKYIQNDAKRYLITYTILFLFASSVIIFIAFSFARFFDVFKLTFFDRMLGAIIFICILSIPCYFILIFLLKVNFNFLGYIDALNNSLLFPYLEKLIFFIIRLPILKHFFVIKKILI